MTSYRIGDKVEYIGSDINLQRQYAGVLEVWEISKSRFGGYTCLTPGRRRATSWIVAEDLKLVARAKLI